MLRQIPLEQVALNLQSTVDEVRKRHEQLIITQDGQPVAALVSIEFFQRWLDERDRAFKFYDNLPTWNLPYSEEEVEADIEQAIREVRSEYKAQ
jgi:prevent-host-death family protein